MAKKKWIQSAIKHPGAEKRAAKKAGITTHEFMEKHKGDSGKSGARARLGLRLSAMSRGRASGGKAKSRADKRRRS